MSDCGGAMVAIGIVAFVAGAAFYSLLLEWGTDRGYTIYVKREKPKP